MPRPDRYAQDRDGWGIGAVRAPIPGTAAGTDWVGGFGPQGAQKGEGGQEVEGAHANVDVHEDEGPREHSDSDSDSDSGGGSSALSVDGGGDSATAQDSRQS